MAVRIPQKLQEWVVARQRHRLSHAHVQMARELGMNPRKLGKIDNHRQEPWKAPLPIFIENCYFKRFGRERPEIMRSIEELSRHQEAKKTIQKARKAARRTAAVAASAPVLVEPTGVDFATPTPPLGSLDEVTSEAVLRWPPTTSDPDQDTTP